MPVFIDAPIVPTETTSDTRVAAVAHARREAMLTIRFGGDGDRYGAMHSIGFAALDVDRREIKAVVEHVLGAEHRIERVGIALSHPQHAAHGNVVDDVLGDRD